MSQTLSLPTNHIFCMQTTRRPFSTALFIINFFVRFFYFTLSSKSLFSFYIRLLKAQSISASSPLQCHYSKMGHFPPTFSDHHKDIDTPGRDKAPTFHSFQHILHYSPYLIYRLLYYFNTSALSSKPMKLSLGVFTSFMKSLTSSRFIKKLSSIIFSIRFEAPCSLPRAGTGSAVENICNCILKTQKYSCGLATWPRHSRHVFGSV